MWWLENNIYRVLVLCECCAACVFSEIVMLHGTFSLQCSCVAAAPHVVSAWALFVCKLNLLHVYRVAVQGLVAAHRDDRIGKPSLSPGLTIKPVGDRTAITSQSALPVSFACWLFYFSLVPSFLLECIHCFFLEPFPNILFANSLFAPWGCCPDVFAVMYQLCLSFLFWSFHPLL